jgi:hypothetical protein
MDLPAAITWIEQKRSKMALIADLFFNRDSYMIRNSGRRKKTQIICTLEIHKGTEIATGRRKVEKNLEGD